MKTSEKIARSEAVIECLEDQLKMLIDPRITIDPLSYIQLQRQIERNHLEAIKAQQYQS